VLALRKREILAQRRALHMAQTEAVSAPGGAPADEALASGHSGQPGPFAAGEAAGPQSAALKSRSDIAKAARLSSNQVVLIEKIQSQAVPELVAAVKAGEISINAAAAVAALPAEEQKAAALGGKDDLKQAAKRVREVKRKPAAAGKEATNEAGSEAMDAAPDGMAHELQALRQRVAELSAENEALRRQLAALQAQA